MIESKVRIIAGNWKMHKTVEEAIAFVTKLVPELKGVTCQVLLAIPFTAIYAAAKAAEGSPLMIGAQNMNNASEGAYTGEIAARMLKEAGASFVLLGHSERRHLFQESDEEIQKKVNRALGDGLTPILCIGETLSEREEGKTEEVLDRQLSTALKDVDESHALELRIAYEPVWAIGTGETATPEIAESAHEHIRNWLNKRFSTVVGAKIPLLYGGSVKAGSSNELLNQKEIDGLLIGGASLSLDSFLKIVHDSWINPKEEVS